jgi:nucleotide-binding universal stress UspA family protein
MNPTHILFPVDFSDSNRTLNPEVEYLASRFGADVTLLHVFEIPSSWYAGPEVPLMSAECLQSYAECVRQQLDEYRINVPSSHLRRVIVQGDPAWQINNCVHENKIDLVMMATHGYGPMRRLLLGSVAMKVLHDVTCAVWTHSREKTFDGKPFDGVKKIVCAVELNEEAVPLLRFVSDLASEFDTSVRLVHSVPDDASRPYRYFNNELHRFLVKVADQEISKIQNEAGTCFDVDLVENPIVQSTALVAAEQKADLMVIGRGKTTHTLGSFRTHTYDIIREAHCPVLSYCAPQTEDRLKHKTSKDASVEVLNAT